MKKTVAEKKASAVAVATAALPAECLAFIPTLPAGERIVVVQRGQKGFKQARYDHVGLTERTARQIVTEVNQQLGVTATARVAMIAGCLHGWDAPLVDAETYTLAQAEDLMKTLCCTGRMH